MRLHVAPTERLLMDPSRIVLLGAPPGAEITLEATLTDRGGQAWSSRGVYFADSTGSVDPSRSASLAGTYRGLDGEALFWSMQPATLLELDAAGPSMDEIDSPRRYPDFDAFDASSEMRLKPVDVAIRARITGDLAEAHPAVLEAIQTVRLVGKRVERTLVSDGEVRGVLFEAPGEGPHPLALVVAGSSGGAWETKASLLASYGITSFAVAWFNYPGRPDHHREIPMEYFSRAMRWLGQRYGERKVAVLGASRGGEAVLLIASLFPDQVSAVVAEVPSNMVFSGFDFSTWSSVPGWLLDGKPLPYVGFENYGLRDSGLWAGSKEVRQNFLHHMAAHDFDDPRWIQVERIEAPILLVSGTADAMWPCSIASQRLVDRLHAKGFAYPVQHLEYAGAGHLLINPMLVPGRADRTEVNPMGFAVSIGGVPGLNAKAQSDAFLKTVEFLKLHA